MTKTNVPRLRFREFDGEYVLSSIKDITNKVKSYSLSRDYEVNDSRTEYVHYGDIHTRLNNIINDGDKLPNIKDGKYTLLKSGDIVVADASEDYNEVAKPMLLENINNRNVVSGLHTIALRLDEVDSLYLYYFMQTDIYKKNCYRLANGMKVYGINYDNLGKIRINLSSYTEQQKIGSFFEKIDKIIELQTKKLEQLKKIKQGYLQKIFPQYGESVPRLRFSGFSDEWKVSKGKAIFYNFSDKNHEGLPPLSVTQDQKIWYRDELDPALSYDKQKLSTYKLIDKNYVVIGLRSFVGGFAISDKRGIVSPAYTILKFRNTPWDFYFTRNLFTSYVFIQSLKKITYGIRVNGRSISYNDFSTLPLVYTDNLEEQKKIGALLNTFDSLIELHEKKLDNIKKMKKAYLQNMFI
ncbi:restriction endonuclease subunit S [Lactobacillus sp. B3795]|uniref:restriction endonuclease subunit S n=1 Tax=Lactobacillus sp. B3795 TaxID=2818036 RepID=UPI00265D1806|nr:restriction endonuclease subunit S [Lactobacillus sp. B3795]MCX8743125.1 restriction endonuclease subunit S [Lactobacillus sp. B3795]